MHEEISIENDGGPLELVGGQRESALLLAGQPMQFTYLREIGSTWRYQIAQSVAEADIIQDARFQNFVKYGLTTADSLAAQFGYLVGKLARGRYRLELTTFNTAIFLWELDAANYQYGHADTYGGRVDILETQAYHDEAVVVEYMGLINKGTEPIVVVLTAQDSDTSFILDGHHKYRAYARLKKPAKALVITRLDAPEIDNKRGLELLVQCNSQDKEYKTRFLNR